MMLQRLNQKEFDDLIEVFEFFVCNDFNTFFQSLHESKQQMIWWDL